MRGKRRRTEVKRDEFGALKEVISSVIATYRIPPDTQELAAVWDAIVNRNINTVPEIVLALIKSNRNLTPEEEQRVRHALLIAHNELESKDTSRFPGT